MTSESALENLARMALVIRGDQELLNWFSSLTRMPLVERRNEIFSRSEQMEREGQDRDLIVCFRLLADARVFEAAEVAVGV